jgi:hypothetical protein
VGLLGTLTVNQLVAAALLVFAGGAHLALRRQGRAPAAGRGRD